MVAAMAPARKLHSRAIAMSAPSRCKVIPFRKRNPLEEAKAPGKKQSGKKDKEDSVERSGLDMRNASVSSTSTQKGLQNKKQGKFDQLWMVKWFDWYKYVVAMTRKAWDLIRSASNRLLSQNVRAESAKIAHSG